MLKARRRMLMLAKVYSDNFSRDNPEIAGFDGMLSVWKGRRGLASVRAECNEVECHLSN